MSAAQICDECRVKSHVVWWTDEPLWNFVVAGHTETLMTVRPGAASGRLAPRSEGVGGLLCPECFSRMATDRGISLTWKPHIDTDRRDGFCSEHGWSGPSPCVHCKRGATRTAPAVPMGEAVSGGGCTCWWDDPCFSCLTKEETQLSDKSGRRQRSVHGYIGGPHTPAMGYMADREHPKAEVNVRDERCPDCNGRADRTLALSYPCTHPFHGKAAR